MRLGVLDVGSNTVHLLVVDAYPGARPLPAGYAERWGSVTIGDRGGIICEGTRLNAPLEAV